MTTFCRHIIIAGVATLSLGASNPGPSTKLNKPKISGQAAPVSVNAEASYEASERRHRAVYEAACDPGKDQRESDLCAQWKAADSAADSASFTKWGVWISSLSTVFVLAALYLTLRANQIARDTAKQQLRAYVSHVKYEMKNHPDSRGNLSYHDITAIWLNCGQTPAFEVRSWINYSLRPDALPDDFNFPPPKDVAGFGTLALGPGRECNCLSPLITHQELLDVSTGALKLFVWSQVDYLDAFKARRSSQVACEVKAVRSQSTLRVVFNALNRHNGMDAISMQSSTKNKLTQDISAAREKGGKLIGRNQP